MSIHLIPNADGSSSFKDDASGREVLRLTANNGANHDPATFVRVLDHFDGDVISDQWSAAQGTDGQGAIAAVVAGEAGGWVRLTCGDTTVVAESLSSLTRGLNWKANKGGLHFKTIVRPLTSVANVSYFVGFTDVLATTTLEDPMSLSGTTLTTTATDAVGFLFDTAADNDTWHCQGVKNGTDTALLNTGLAPAAATEQVLEIFLDTSGNATFLINGSVVGTVAAAVTATVALTPVITVMARTTTVKSLDADFVLVESLR